MSIREFFRWLYRGIRHRCWFCNRPAEFLIDELPMCRECGVKFLKEPML